MRTFLAFLTVVIALIVGAGWSFGLFERAMPRASLANEPRADAAQVDPRGDERESALVDAAPLVPTAERPASPVGDPQPSEESKASTDPRPDEPLPDPNDSNSNAGSSPRTDEQRDALASALREDADDRDLRLYVGWKWNQVAETFGWPDYGEPGEWFYEGPDDDYGLHFEFEQGVVKVASLLPQGWKAPERKRQP